jgi:hypothetical protein
MPSIFDQDLPRTEANFAPMSPLSFLERTAEVYPQHLAIVHGSLRHLGRRCMRGAASWQARWCATVWARGTRWP